MITDTSLALTKEYKGNEHMTNSKDARKRWRCGKEFVEQVECKTGNDQDTNRQYPVQAEDASVRSRIAMDDFFTAAH